jgi:hypothetical protein
MGRLRFVTTPGRGLTPGSRVFIPRIPQDEKTSPMSKPQLRWTSEGAASDFEAARTFLSLLGSEAKVNAIVKALHKAKIVDHAAKDLLRAAQLPLLPRDDPHVDADLKRIHKGKALAPILVVRGDVALGLPLIVADGYHRICAVWYFDENAPVRCRIVSGGR